MKKAIFSVLDTKAEIFCTPFVSVNSLVAMRNFSDAANDPSTEISRNPGDFILYEIGVFDDVNGTVSGLQANINHGIPVKYRPINPEG